MRMHFLEGRVAASSTAAVAATVGGQDSKATREGNVEYWNSVPWSVPYGESGGGGGLMVADEK